MKSELGRKILGIRFFVGTAAEAVVRGLQGGLVSVPSAPVLLFIQHDPVHRDALLNADLVIVDSGAMVLLWRLLTGEKIPRVSGLAYLKLVLEQPELREPGATAWVMPSTATRNRTLRWLTEFGFPTTAADCYVAPEYQKTGRIDDPALLEFIERRRPQHVIIALGGCTQERLGWCLRKELSYKPGLHGIGAAIGFLTGEQTNIPKWADRFYLGWLVRCLAEPSRFVPRYWAARKLIPLMIKYRDRLPPLLIENDEQPARAGT